MRDAGNNLCQKNLYFSIALDSFSTAKSLDSQLTQLIDPLNEVALETKKPMNQGFLHALSVLSVRRMRLLSPSPKDIYIIVFSMLVVRQLPNYSLNNFLRLIKKLDIINISTTKWPPTAHTIIRKNK